MTGNINDILSSLVVWIIWITVGTHGQNQIYRFCVPEYFLSLCQQMIQDTTINSPYIQSSAFTCVTARDKVDCLQKIYHNEADIAPFDPEEIFIAGKNLKDDFFIIKEIRTNSKQNDEFRYESVAVVRNSAGIRTLSDLKMKRSCHTGYGKTTGWQVPVPKLISMGIMSNQCERFVSSLEREILAVSRFFGRSCVPGPWAPDVETDRMLKNKYRNLCDLCGDPNSCDGNDRYAKYTGTLDCLTTADGDVAWTKLDAVKEYFSLGSRQSVPNNPRAVNSEYSFLCADGSSRPLESNRPCTWAGRPWKAFLVKRTMPQTFILDLQNRLSQARSIGYTNPSGFQWVSKVMEYDTPDQVDYNPNTLLPPSQYLEKANYTTTIVKPDCDGDKLTFVRICVSSDIESAKCESFRIAAYARRIRPEIGCVRAESSIDCMSKIRDELADVVALDAGLVYTAGKDFSLIPVLSETYQDVDASYFAVAVIKGGSNIQKLADLHGKKSCHTGYGRTAGWNVPVHVLKQKGLISSSDCAFGIEMGQFFSQSCAPGARTTDNDNHQQNPESLCALCAGEDVTVPPVGPAVSSPIPVTGPLYRGTESRCLPDHSEAFWGYTGAFRCLVQGGGDVAFVKHNTVLLNTDGRSNASWAMGLRSGDFRLLCKDGGTMPVDHFAACHWGKVPAHKIMINSQARSHKLEDVRLSLLRASEIFNPTQLVFRLFGPYEEHSDLLFKDSTTALVNVLPGSSYLEALDEDYVKMLQEIRDCNISNQIRYSIWNICVVMVVTLTHRLLLLSV